MGIGGGGFGGGIGGGHGLGGGGFGSGVATAGGAPFAGVPPELVSSVERLVATEPEHPEPDARFAHRPPKGQRSLSIINLMRRRWQVSLLSLIFVTVETIGYQVGPFLTKIG